MSDDRGRRRLPVKDAAAVGGGVALAGGVTALVLMVVGASLFVAGLSVLAGIAVAGVSLPFAIAAGRSRKSLRPPSSPPIIDAHATSRELPAEPSKRTPEKVKDVLDRLEAGEVSAEQAIDELK